MRARASGSPAATQRSQKPDTMSVSDAPARPAWVSHSDNSAKKASFTPRLYSHNGRLWHAASDHILPAKLSLSQQSGVKQMLSRPLAAIDFAAARADFDDVPGTISFCCEEPCLGDRRLAVYSGFRLAALTTLLHFSVCSARCFPNSEGEATNGLDPSSASRAFSFASARPALISLFSLSTISALVLLGAQTPYQALASYPGKNSPTVGVSGSAPERAAPVVASARNLPVRTYSIDEGNGLNSICTWPPSRSVSAAAERR